MALRAEAQWGYSWDRSGNPTQDSLWSYAWDGENRLIWVTTRLPDSALPAKRIEFQYDWLGRRVAKHVYASAAGGTPTSSCFLYDGWNLIAIVNASKQLTKSFVWGLDVSGTEQGAGGVGGLLMFNDHSTGTATYVTGGDANGNVMLLVNVASGAVAARYEYGPYGEPIRLSGESAGTQTLPKLNPFRYSTKFTDDESGLLYYGYRYYQPYYGRWLNPDPLGEAGGVNLYAFCGNDPANRIDRNGLDNMAPHFMPGTSGSTRNAAPSMSLTMTPQLKGVNPPPQTYLDVPGAPRFAPLPRERLYESTGVNVLTVAYCNRGDVFSAAIILVIDNLPATVRALSRWEDALDRTASRRDCRAALIEAGPATVLLLLPVTCKCTCPLAESGATVDRIRSVAQKAFSYAVQNPRFLGLKRMQLGKDAEVQATRWLRRWAERNDVRCGSGGLQFQVSGANSVPDVVFDPALQIFDFKLTP